MPIHHFMWYKHIFYKSTLINTYTFFLSFNLQRFIQFFLSHYSIHWSIKSCKNFYLSRLTHILILCIFLLFFQKSCIDFTIQARPLERYMPKERNSVKYRIWRIVVSTPFEYFIMILIVLNTLLLMMKVSVTVVSFSPALIRFLERFTNLAILLFFPNLLWSSKRIWWSKRRVFDF